MLISDPSNLKEALRLAEAENERLRTALVTLWGFWNDRNRCRMKADYLRGHLSYYSTLEELERPIVATLSVTLIGEARWNFAPKL